MLVMTSFVDSLLNTPRRFSYDVFESNWFQKYTASVVHTPNELSEAKKSQSYIAVPGSFAVNRSCFYRQWCTAIEFSSLLPRDSKSSPDEENFNFATPFWWKQGIVTIELSVLGDQMQSLQSLPVSADATKSSTSLHKVKASILVT